MAPSQVTAAFCGGGAVFCRGSGGGGEQGAGERRGRFEVERVRWRPRALVSVTSDVFVVAQSDAAQSICTHTHSS
jgi:hypothetical protein